MINRNCKDTLFRMLFGTEEYKENALNHTDCKDVNELELTTIQNVIYIGRSYRSDS